MSDLRRKCRFSAGHDVKICSGMSKEGVFTKANVEIGFDMRKSAENCQKMGFLISEKNRKIKFWILLITFIIISRVLK